MEPSYLRVTHSLLGLVLLCLAKTTFGEVYTALVDLEGLLVTEAEVIRSIDNYIAAEENRLHRLKELKHAYEENYEEASKNIKIYLENPINAYTIVKSLTIDWKHVEQVMMENAGKNVISNISQSLLKFPDEEDLKGAAAAVLRLQDTYNLDTNSLAKGQLQGVKVRRELTASDCFELARQAYNANDFHHAILWMRQALMSLERISDKTVPKEDVLEYLAFSLYKQGNIVEAAAVTEDLLKIAPTHERAVGNRVYYQHMLKSEDFKKKGEEGSLTSNEEAPASGLTHERRQYEKLCRGENLLDPKFEAKLKCRYIDNNHPYLKIGKIKEEDAYLSPRIVIYHDIMFDREIEKVMTLAHPRLQRATVQNYITGELETAHYRISKSAWLRTEEDETIAALCHRIGAVTGLDLDTAEELQVVNYGIGGHYEPHFDFAKREEKNAFKSLGTGNRIATWLNYMSDVESGGATVFPYLGISLWPKKGTAAFWYNLHKNGEGDDMTRHAACPVLVGSKWVSNKWFHERGQEFRRKCGLTFDEE